MKKAILKSYGKKGEKVVNMNYQAVDCGYQRLVEVKVPEEWASLEPETAKVDENLPEFVKNLMLPINSLKGDSLPVSAFTGREDGTVPLGTSKYEKRGTAVDVPEWDPDKCLQCNQCSYVCPHAAVRPFLVSAAEAENAPEGFKTKKATGKGLEEYTYRIQVSPLDCLGCGACVQVCPAKEKALTMKPLDSQAAEIENWNYAVKLSKKKNPLAKNTVKGSQFETPLLEFSGACAGCGETPYAKLATQLYGDRMYIANATGCSSIWGGSAPSTPYTVDKNGHGPAWSNSLFEDNAEFGYGMMLAQKQIRERLAADAQVLLDTSVSAEAQAWLDTYENAATNTEAADALIAALENAKLDGEANDAKVDFLKDKDYAAKKYQFIFGGDGWAYDIGFGGLDHVIAQNQDVNIVVFDTEVYSNTGGQASKATPTGAVAKFAASGKVVKKKDLAQIAMSYGYVYVAQVAMGANAAQCLKAFQEAAAYNGPSLIICRLIRLNRKRLSQQDIGTCLDLILHLQKKVKTHSRLTARLRRLITLNLLRVKQDILLLNAHSRARQRNSLVLPQKIQLKNIISLLSLLISMLRAKTDKS